MSTFRYALPFTYVLGTRLNNEKSWLMLPGCEWLPAVLVLWLLAALTPLEALGAFALGYLAFISLYEIGYILNDRVSVRLEVQPRRRINQASIVQLTTWIGTRLAAFAALVVYLDLYQEPRAWLFYGLLVAAFTLHNLLASAALRIGTFVNLALLRVLAPVFPFVADDELALLIVPALTGLVLYRTLSYMESKDLLRMPQRRTLRFAVALHLSMIGPNAVAALALDSWWPLYGIAYYIAFWLLLTLASSLRGRGAAHA